MKSKSKRKYRAMYKRCAHAATTKGEETSSMPDEAPKILLAGMTGFLVTTDRFEGAALREAYRVLNEAVERRTGIDPRKSDSSTELKQPIQNVSSSRDVEVKDEVEDVLSQLKEENRSNDKEKDENLTSRKFYFNYVRTGVKQCIFILQHYEKLCATEIAHEVYAHLLETKLSETRFIRRLLPVAVTCAAHTKDIVRCMHVLWQTFLDPDTEDSDGLQANVLHRMYPAIPPYHASEATLTGRKTFQVLFRTRNYNNISRDDTLREVISVIKKIDISWEFTHHAPAVTVAINILRNVACLSILENFEVYRKYNVAELIDHINPKLQHVVAEDC